MTKEQDIEQGLISKLEDLKYTYRPDIRDRLTLEENFRRKFEELNKVRLSDTEFERLKEQIVTPSPATSVPPNPKKLLTCRR
jgi:type I restriction enzyme R subunit